MAYSQNLFAQTWLKGRVVDAETNQALAGASVQVLGTQQGAVTNRTGAFELGISTLPSRIVVRFLGYETLRFDLERIPERPILVQLKPTSIELSEVVISGEDPAVGIMRQVIARKQRMYDAFATYSAEVFTRFTLKTPREIVQIKETNADVFWRAGLGFRELIRARRNVPKTEESFRFADREGPINFYDDFVRLNGINLPAPTHPQALSYYHFRLGDKREQASKEVADIYLSPANASQPGLVGVLQVDLTDFVVLQAELKPNKTIQSDVVRDFDVTYRQTFREWTSDIYVPVSLEIEGRVLMGRTGVTYPAVSFKQQNAFQNIRVNRSVPDSLFRQPLTTLVEPLADQRLNLIRRVADVLPYTKAEYEFSAKADSRLPLSAHLKPDGFLAPYLGEEVVDRPMSGVAQVLNTVSKVLPFLGLNRTSLTQPPKHYKLKDLVFDLGLKNKLGLRIWEKDRLQVLDKKELKALGWLNGTAALSSELYPKPNLENIRGEQARLGFYLAEEGCYRTEALTTGLMTTIAEERNQFGKSLSAQLQNTAKPASPLAALFDHAAAPQSLAWIDYLKWVQKRACNTLKL